MIQLIDPIPPSQEELDVWYENLVRDEDRNLSKAETKRKSLDEDVIRKLRALAKTDLFFLATGILGYDRLSPNLHGHLITWREKNIRWRFKEFLMPRATFKSTIITISATIQDILPFDSDVDQSLISTPGLLGPNGRHLITHEVDKMAQGYLFSISRHFMSNELLMALFSECVPSAKKHKINSSELEIPHTKIWNESTVSAMGVTSSKQGVHVDRIVLDDIIGKKARDSEIVMEEAKIWVDNIQSFFVRLALGVIEIAGTRYGPNDVYEHIEDRYGDQLKIYRRAMEEADPNDLDENDKPRKKSIFPEEVGAADLEILKKNPIVYAAQYMNDPEGGNTKFDPNWIRWFRWDSETSISPLLPEPHLRKRINLADLNTVLLWDPAVSGLSGYNVVGTDYGRRNFVLESREEILSPPEAVEKFFSLYAKYHFRALCIEEVLFSELYRHWLEVEFKVRGVRFNIIPVKTKEVTKSLRVLGLAPYLAGGQLLFNSFRYSKQQDRTGKFSDLIYQIHKFGNVKSYHALDALAYLPEVIMAGIDQDFYARIKQSEEARLKERSNLTGYSKVIYG